jgi:hypothetical protein
LADFEGGVIECEVQYVLPDDEIYFQRERPNLADAKARAEL